MGCQAVLDCRGFLFQCALGPALVLVDEERAALDVAVLAHSDQDGLVCFVLNINQRVITVVYLSITDCLPNSSRV